jgi:hypothetical protein
LDSFHKSTCQTLFEYSVQFGVEPYENEQFTFAI